MGLEFRTASMTRLLRFLQQLEVGSAVDQGLVQDLVRDPVQDLDQDLVQDLVHDLVQDPSASVE